MRVTAKADYAVRAAIELARHEGSPSKGDDLARAQEIPLSFLENILNQLKSAGLVRTQRGPEGGYWLARPAGEITLAEIIRAVEGPLVGVRGERPEDVDYPDGARTLQEVWIALRHNVRAVLEHVTLADAARGRLPADVRRLARDEEAWHTR
jgi:Rrf2 family protein